MLYNPKWQHADIEERKPWQQVLLDTADLIEREGWCRGAGKVGGPHCIVTAMSSAIRPGSGEAYRRLGDYLGTGVIPWNVARGRTIAQVLAALRGCADSR